MGQEGHDTIIIGGGPAGAAAAVYAARKKMKTLLITEEFGGQSVVSSSIENWIGDENITGLDLAKRLEKHARAQEGLEIKSPEKVTKVNETPDCRFEVKTDKGAYLSKTVMVASGARRRRLKVLGEDRLEGKGVAFCSTCDAPFFKDQDVAVIGGGNAALETAVDLFPYAKKIYLLIRGEDLKGDPVTQEKVKQSSQVKLIQNVEVREILGDKTVTGLRYKDRKQGEVKELSVGGVFVEIGSVPNSEFIRNLVETNEAREIVIDHLTAKTSKEGIFAAGDVTNDPFKQNNISAGDGVRAALSAYNCLLHIKKYSPCEEEGDLDETIRA
jgi:alkyl hydroperoxide reductase subunit F